MPDYDNTIDDILSRTDIVDLIGERVHLTKRGANYVGLCPFHSEKTGSFSVNRSKRMFYCFGCHKGGNAITFLKEYDNMTGGEAIRYLAEKAGIELPKGRYEADNEKEKERETLFEINKEAATFYFHLLSSDDGKLGREYFKSRGLDEKTVIHYGLGYSDAGGDTLYRHLKDMGYSDDLLVKSGLVIIDEKRGAHDRFWNRVMFPIMNERGRVLGFGGRVMGQGEPKYLNSPETKIFDKSNTLYGIKDAKRSRQDVILICEGYMDVISLFAAGFDNAVAALGTAFTARHAKKIKAFGKKVVLTFDSDGAGRDAAVRAIPILRREGVNCRVLSMTPHKDPDEFIRNLGAAEYGKRIESAEYAFNFELEQMEKKFNMADTDDKNRFFYSIADHIAEITRGRELEKNNYIITADSLYHMGVNELTREVNNALERSPAPQEDEQDTSEGEVLAVPSYRRKAPESGLVKSQKLLLTWAATDKAVIKAMKRYLEPSHFTGIYAKLCGLIYDNAEAGLGPAMLIERLPEDEQAEATAIFSYDLVPDTDEASNEKIFADTVRNILEKELKDREEAIVASNNFAALSKLEEEKKELKKKSITLKEKGDK